MTAKDEDDDTALDNAENSARQALRSFKHPPATRTAHTPSLAHLAPKKVRKAVVKSSGKVVKARKTDGCQTLLLLYCCITAALLLL